MFTDMVASTARAARLGPQRADSLRRAHFELVRGILAEYRGAEVKTLGDGVMAVFDSSADAVDAAVALQQALEETNRAIPDAAELRVGLSVGEVSEEGQDYFGRAVVEAARLCAEAQPRQVLCTSIVRALAEGQCGHVFAEAGTRTLKGLPKAVAVDEVTWIALVEPSLHGDFTNIDERQLRPALTCLDVQRQNPFFVEVGARVLELLGPRPGQTLVDVGSGAGHDVLRLAQLVGETGTAIGVDKSEELVVEARHRAVAEGVGNAEFRVGSAEQLPLEDNSVDGACSDRVLQYLPNPGVAVAEMVRVTRSGGNVVIADTDWGVSMFDCDDMDLSERVMQAWTATRVSGRVGRRLPAYFVRAGLDDVTVEPRFDLVTVLPHQGVVPFYREAIVPGVAAQAVSAGAVTPEEASRWVALQEAAMREGRFLRLLMMFIVSGRV